MKIHSLQHVPFEDLASIADWAQARGHEVSITHLYQNTSLPDVSDLDMLVVLGGPMNVDDEHLFPWLSPEKQLIAQAIQAKKLVLGICLGSQLIASVLGARVHPNIHKEIGWFPVSLTIEGSRSPVLAGFPATFSAFHWHGDTFELPPGAVHLAQSEACRHQAFSFGRTVLGLQFHLESTIESVTRMLDHEADDLTDGPFVQTQEAIMTAGHHFETSMTLMHRLLDAFTASTFESQAH